MHTGDTIRLPDIIDLIIENEHRIMNTGLFTAASISVKNIDSDSSTISLNINLTESWYIYPAPLLEFLDNDLNKWLYNYKLSLTKISYGLNLRHINLTGNADKLSAYVQGGFTRKFSLEYNFPYLNKKKTLGAGFLFFYAKNRDLAYMNYQNKLIFYRDESLNLLTRTKFGFSVNYRPYLFWTFSMFNNFIDMRVDESVRRLLNPDYLPAQRLFLHELTLFAAHDSRNIAPYPTRGKYFNAWFTSTENFKKGQIHQKQIGAYAGFYTLINNQWSLSNTICASYNLDRAKTPYFFTKSLGYNDESLRGYENYVMNGQDYAYSRNSLRFLVWDKVYQLQNYMPLKAYRTLPVRIYLTANTDIGYVNDRFYSVGNSFVNRPLIGGGIGLDIVFYYNKLLRIEYSVNHTGENGLYLHFNAGL
jgi:hypothetical protein